MQVIEIEDNLAVKISEAAQSENKSLRDFVDLSLRDVLKRIEHRKTDEEKVKKFIESYEKFPQKAEEYEIWQDEQVWSES